MHRIIAIIMMITTVLSVKAQDWYVGASTGFNHSMSENMRAKELLGHEIPGVNVFIGDNITPKWGTRLHLGLLKPQNGRAGTPQNMVWPKKYGRFHFNTSTADLDVTANLSNLLGDVDPLREFEFYGILGGGALYTWWFSPRVESWQEYYPIDTRKRMYWNVHGGIQCQQKLNKHWKMAYEVKCYMLPDEYNGVDIQVAFDTFLDFSVGAIYYFDASKRIEILPVEVRHDYLPPYEAFPAADGNTENARLLFYTGSHSLIDSQKHTLSDIAIYAKQHPSSLVVLTTYPDNEKLPKEQNTRLSRQREQEIVKTLVNEYGIESPRIVTESRALPLYSYADVGDWIVGATITVR